MFTPANIFWRASSPKRISLAAISISSVYYLAAALAAN
jgi:hypothetical protein